MIQRSISKLALKFYSLEQEAKQLQNPVFALAFFREKGTWSNTLKAEGFFATHKMEKKEQLLNKLCQNPVKHAP